MVYGILILFYHSNSKTFFQETYTKFIRKLSSVCSQFVIQSFSDLCIWPQFQKLVQKNCNEKYDLKGFFVKNSTFILGVSKLV